MIPIHCNKQNDQQSGDSKSWYNKDKKDWDMDLMCLLYQ